MRSQDTIFSLYARAYPQVLAILSRLRESVQGGGMPPVTLLALFGSVAVLTAGSSSDADLLVLFDDAQTVDVVDVWATAFVRVVRTIEEETGSGSPDWPISVIPAGATARELDADLLDSIGREGVLVYQRAGAPRPDALRRLEPFDDWQRRVRELLALLPQRTPPV